MNEKAICNRIESNLKREDTLDQLIAAHGEKLRATMEEYKSWLAVELRRAHQQIALLTQEKDLLIKNNLKQRNIIEGIRKDLDELRKFIWSSRST